MHRNAEARWAQDDGLNDLLLRVRGALPGLDGRVGSPRPDELMLDRPQSLAALLAHWQAAHPAAGRHYWAARCWTLLVWQPIYLQVLAVQLDGQAPCLDGMAQGVEQGFVAGFCLPAHQPLRADSPRLLRHAGQQIRHFCEQAHAACGTLLGLHPKLAQRLAADCVMAALLHTLRTDGCGNLQLCRCADAWLDACAMRGASGLLAVQLEDGGTRLGLQRKACCQHFRRADGELCDSCPKLPLAERSRRLREQHG
ncbi:siderophore ferric iron reductase [Stutzerimonas stutzeri]|jgi:siderophore ferric iron reductase|uniref:Siderophore ferric iron reductase, AHA_1954 family n=1 Tax=Stutzerimonas stutzeri RCH2 TaxID=644801 RepID=L0GHJ1_STUST|nr:siderophore ferric iron reductase [Stutzerimonas stutzeri]AGA85242.1 siderophore ferric iron reductase, AHA_1954 family [Stutzerimonas stutzeri RCH2]